MGSSWLNGTFFPPPQASAMLDYQPRSRYRSSARAARRPERHNPCSIATIRIILARYLLGQLPHCPFCGARSG